MYCPQCGTQNDNSAAFCGNCGTKLSDYNGSNASSSQNAANIVHTNLRVTAQYSDNPLLNEIKKFIVSPLTLITALAFSLMIIFFISNAEMTGISVMGYIRNVLNVVDNDALRYVTAVPIGIYRFFAVIIMLPNIIIAIGIWKTIYAASDKKNNSLALSGFRIIKIMNVISIILNSVSLLFFFSYSIHLFSTVYKANKSLITLVAVICIMIMAIYVMNIILYKKANDIIYCVEYSVYRKIPSHDANIFVAVMAFINCGCYVFLGLFGGNVFDSFYTWCGVIAYVGFGVLFLRYKNKMVQITDSFRTFNSEEADDCNTENISVCRCFDKKYVIFAIAAVAVACIIAKAANYTAPGVDKALVGKWQYGSNEEAVTEFKRNGTFIGNAGTEYEEIGTYTANDGVITVIIDGEINEINYQVIDSDRIKVERSYITANWERKYRWETLYRVD